MEGSSVVSDLVTGSVRYLLVSPRYIYSMLGSRLCSLLRLATSSARFRVCRLGFSRSSSRSCWFVRCGGELGEPGEGSAHPKHQTGLAEADDRSSCVMAEGTAEVRVEEGASKVIEDEAALNLAGGSSIPSGGALVTMAAGSNQDAAKEEFDFDPGDVEGTVERKWFAMARYYSTQRSRGLFAEMGAAWRSEKPIPVRPLDDNRFILEFEDEEIYKFVINGDPWRHKGDALICGAI